MAKVSIGLRGWRFDEEAVLAPDGTLKPIEEMPEDAQDRIVRLTEIVGDVCDACWLAYDDEATRERADVVYGEPLAEVLLCREHEPDFLYWYREAGGDEYRGSDEFADAFHEWFLDGGRAPEGYGGVEHVETDPRSIPDPSALAGAVETGERIDLREGDPGSESEQVDEDDLVEADVDLDADYPG